MVYFFQLICVIHERTFFCLPTNGHSFPRMPVDFLLFWRVWGEKKIKHFSHFLFYFCKTEKSVCNFSLFSLAKRRCGETFSLSIFTDENLEQWSQLSWVSLLNVFKLHFIHKNNDPLIACPNYRSGKSTKILSLFRLFFNLLLFIVSFSYFEEKLLKKNALEEIFSARKITRDCLIFYFEMKRDFTKRENFQNAAKISATLLCVWRESLTDVCEKSVV